MRSSDNTEAIPEFIVLAWTEVWLWQSSANTTLRLEQDFYGRHCKPYGFFFFWLGPMWICPIRRHARQREDGGTSFKGLMRCHCLTVLEIVYITHLWSVISPHFTLPLDTVKRNEKKKPCLFLLSTNQCKDQRSSFLMSPLFIWSGHTPGTLRVICPIKVTLTWRTKISLTYNSYFRVSSLCPFEAYCKAVLWLPDSFVLQLRVFFFLLSFLSTSSAPPLQHLGSLATQSSHCIPS